MFWREINFILNEKWYFISEILKSFQLSNVENKTRASWIHRIRWKLYRIQKRSWNDVRSWDEHGGNIGEREET